MRTAWLGVASAGLLFVAGTAFASLLPTPVPAAATETTTGTVPASAPAAPVLAPLAADATGVTLTWTATSSSDGTPAAFYTIYRGEASGEESWLGTVKTVTTYKDTTTVKGNAYAYQVTASNNGESARSNERAITATGPRTPKLLQAAQLYPVGSWPEAVAIGDVTGDGRNDVVMTTSYDFDPVNDFHLFVFAQNADGTLAPPVSYATAAHYTNRAESVAIGDITGDGRKDVVVAITDVGVQVFPQTATGSLGSPTLTATTDSYKIRLGRLNGDDRLDVAGVGWGNHTSTPSVSVLLNNGSGGLQPPVSYPVQHDGWDDLEVGDVSGDGRDDLIVMSGQGTLPNFGVLAQQATGGFGPPAYYKVSQTTTILTDGIGVGDVTGDGRNDVVATYGGNAGKIAAFAQTSVGTLAAPVAYPSYAFRHRSTSPISTWTGVPTSWTVHDGWNAVGVYRQKLDHALAAEEVFYDFPYTASYNPHELAVGDVTWGRSPRRRLCVLRLRAGRDAELHAFPRGDGARRADADLDNPGDCERRARLDARPEGGSKIIGYRIYRATASGAETGTSGRSASTPRSPTRTSRGEPRTSTASARVNGVGESAQSNELSSVALSACRAARRSEACRGRRLQQGLSRVGLSRVGTAACRSPGRTRTAARPAAPRRFSRARGASTATRTRLRSAAQPTST